MIFKKKPNSNQNRLEVLRGYSKELSAITQLKDLLKRLIKTWVEIAEAQNGNIWLMGDQGKSLELRESSGGDPLLTQFSSTDSFVNFLGQTETVLTKHELVKDASLIDIKESGLNFMTTASAEAVYPLVVENKFIGMMALGGRLDQNPYSGEQLDWMGVLVTMGAISIDNALLYDSLAKQNLKLSEIAKLKTQFVSTISHELSTPLHGILGMTEILLNPEIGGPLSDDQKRYLQMIQSAGEELSELVNQILGLTRFQSQQGTLEVKKVDFRKTLTDLEQGFREVLENKGIQLQVNLEPKVNVYGDEGQIRQVVQSLIENALKFSGENSGKIIVIQANKHGDMLKVCVQDQGIGIGEGDQELIFDEFRQVEGEVNRSYGGTGLGLAVAKRIVELHGGRIWVESKKGEGSQFYFTLPLKPGLVQVTELDTARTS